MAFVRDVESPTLQHVIVAGYIIGAMVKDGETSLFWMLPRLKQQAIDLNGGDPNIDHWSIWCEVAHGR